MSLKLLGSFNFHIPQAEKSKILLNPSPSLEEAEAQYALSEAPPSFPAAVENKHPGGGLRGIKKITLYQVRYV